MSFEMGQGDQDIRIHQRTADLCLFDILALHRNKYLIGTFQSVCDDNRAAGSIRSKSIHICSLQMIYRIFTASYIQRITICQKRFSTLFFYDICNDFCIIRAQKCQISIFSKMNFDRCIMILKINVFDTSSLYQPCQLLHQIFCKTCFK